MQIEIAFAYLSTGSVILPILIAAYKPVTLKSKSIRALLYLLLGSLVSDLTAFTLAKNGINTALLGNAYFLFQFLLIAYIFSVELPIKGIIRGTMVAFSMYFCINLFMIQGIFVFNTQSNSIGGLILVGLSLYYLFHVVRNLQAQNSYNSPMLWFTFAVLFYYGGTLLLFLLNNYLVVQDLGTHRLVWILHNFCNIVKNILFAIALWQNYRNPKQYL
jgi:hypothetical protein